LVAVFVYALAEPAKSPQITKMHSGVMIVIIWHYERILYSNLISCDRYGALHMWCNCSFNFTHPAPTPSPEHLEKLLHYEHSFGKCWHMHAFISTWPENSSILSTSLANADTCMHSYILDMTCTPVVTQSCLCILCPAGEFFFFFFLSFTLFGPFWGGRGNILQPCRGRIPTMMQWHHENSEPSYCTTYDWRQYPEELKTGKA
jgi:hypothetical protein